MIPPPLIPLLKLHQQAQQAERESAGERWRDYDLVWCHEDGRPIDAGQDWDEWKELLRLAEVEKDARVHDARHTAATLLIEQGVDINSGNPRPLTTDHDEALHPHHGDTLDRSSSPDGPGSLGLTATGNATGRASGSWRSGSPPRSLR
ncbi:tyrosine-type recombinase/integrase [Nonomuraea sp. NPDC003201]